MELKLKSSYLIILSPYLVMEYLVLKINHNIYSVIIKYTFKLITIKIYYPPKMVTLLIYLFMLLILQL